MYKHNAIQFNKYMMSSTSKVTPKIIIKTSKYNKTQNKLTPIPNNIKKNKNTKNYQKWSSINSKSKSQKSKAYQVAKKMSPIKYSSMKKNHIPSSRIR